jgi:hypothetical protein
LSTVGDIQAKDDWGSEWEEWQDYFWQHRRVGLSEKVANPNADRGFNSFLRCIENLERLRGNGASGMNTIRLEVIKKHLGILHWLEAQKESFKSAFSYAGWVDGWFSEVWETFNQVDTVDWTAPPGDNTKSTDHNRMVLVWGSLLCVLFALEKGNDDLQILDPKQIFRAVRIFYLRYHNYGKNISECTSFLFVLCVNLVNVKAIASFVRIIPSIDDKVILAKYIRVFDFSKNHKMNFPTIKLRFPLWRECRYYLTCHRINFIPLFFRLPNDSIRLSIKHLISDSSVLNLRVLSHLADICYFHYSNRTTVVSDFNGCRDARSRDLERGVSYRHPRAQIHFVKMRRLGDAVSCVLRGLLKLDSILVYLNLNFLIAYMILTPLRYYRSYKHDLEKT